MILFLRIELRRIPLLGRLTVPTGISAIFRGQVDLELETACFSSSQPTASKTNGRLSRPLKTFFVQTLTHLSVPTKVSREASTYLEKHASFIADYCFPVEDCNNPLTGYDPNRMVFTPTPPHVGTTTTIVCAPGFFPKPSKAPNVTVGSDIDPLLQPGQNRCTGRRANLKKADPSKYRTRFIQSGYALPDCEGTHNMR